MKWREGMWLWGVWATSLLWGWSQEMPSGERPVPPPQGAVVLFDGKSLENWTNQNWLLVDGAMEVRGGSTRSKMEFGDFYLHVEFWLPLMANRRGQGRANSGVYLHGLYEIQVLDSYNNDTYPTGMCAALYGQKPPDKNVARPPEHWQTYDIYFRAPRLDEKGEVKERARVTVFWNGVKVHDNVEIQGSRPRTKGPILLQDHGCPVRYRNIWLVPDVSSPKEFPPVGLEERKAEPR